MNEARKNATVRACPAASQWPTPAVMIVETRQSAVRRGHPGKQQRQPNAPSDRVLLPLRLGVERDVFFDGRSRPPAKRCSVGGLGLSWPCSMPATCHLCVQLCFQLCV